MATISAPEQAPPEVPVRAPSYTPWAMELPVRTPEGVTLRPEPLVLAERAQRALHAHAVRDLARAVVLLGTDVFVLVALRFGLRALLDVSAVAGVATWIASLAPADSRSLTMDHVWWLVTTSDAKAVIAILLGLAFAGAYRPGDHRKSTTLMVGGVFIGVILNGWDQLWRVPEAIPVIVAGGFAAGLVLAAARQVLDRVVQATRRLWDTPRRAIVVGEPSATSELLSASALAKSRAFSMLGTVEPFLDPNQPRSNGSLGGIGDLPRLLGSNEVETVIVAGSLSPDSYARVVNIADAAGCTVFAVPSASSLRGFDPELEWYGGEAMIRLSRPGMQARHLVAKRALDVVASAAGLLVLAPLLAAIAVAVRLTSPGPAIFSQERFGRGCRRFRIYKFRTMVADAEAKKKELAAQSVYESPHMFKMERDPRITRIGAFLRKTSLDELPQLWNVLIGDMSLVGPRPLPDEGAEFEEHHTVRLCVRPGITGPWQVSGRNSITDFEQVVALEEDYIRSWSLWRDVQILWQTVPAVVMQRGAC